MNPSLLLSVPLLHAPDTTTGPLSGRVQASSPVAELHRLQMASERNAIPPCIDRSAPCCLQAVALCESNGSVIQRNVQSSRGDVVTRSPIERAADLGRSGAAVEESAAFTESGVRVRTPSPPTASKGIATLAGMWFTRYPGEQERVATGSSTAVAMNERISRALMQKGINHDPLVHVKRIDATENERAIDLTPLRPGGRHVNASGQPNTQSVEFSAASVRQGCGRRTTYPNSIARSDGPNINGPERKQESHMQRLSEPQLIAEGIDNIIPFVRRKLAADGHIDHEDQAILDELSGYSDRAIQHAEILDFAMSAVRVGFTKRNVRRLRDLAPVIGPGAA